VPAAAPGLDRLAYRAADGAGYADITLSGVTVAADALLNGTEDDIEAVLDNATVALCADAFGALSVLVDSTVEYAKTRSQFGRPIGQFQALQHRMAEMAVMREEARAALLLGIVKADAPAAERIRATSAAKAKIGRCARFIGQQAVQLHGGMGVTEELNIGAYFKRLISFEILFGNTDFHLRRYAALAASTDILSKSLLSAPQAA
jgi:alkylation response protein AidB-like acyl-CoA dehydrogenase